MLLDAKAVWFYPEQVKPFIAHQITHRFVLVDDRVNRRARGLDENTQAQRGMTQGPTIVQ